MGIINRITTTLTASVDKAVSQVENHDAVIDVSIKDCRTALSKAQVRYSRVKKDKQNLQAKLKELEEMQTTWENRAKSVAKDDEKTALDCLHRKNLCKQRIANTQQALVQHEELEHKVGASISKIEQRLSHITQQRNMMRSRHSAADALRTINSIEGSSKNDVDDTFERWEMVISEAEYEVGQELESVDLLDKSFAEKEDEAVLKAELAELMADSMNGDKHHE
jgi:phage shock protein A